MKPKIVETVRIYQINSDDEARIAPDYYLESEIPESHRESVRAVAQVIEVPIRGYTFRERLEAETLATTLTDGQVRIDQATLVLYLLEQTTQIQSEFWASLPYRIASAVWQRVEEASQLPKDWSWLTSASKRCRSAKGETEPTIPSSDGASSG